MKLKKFAKSASAVVPGLAEKDSEKREPNKGVFGRDLSDLLAFQQTTIPTVVTDVASYLENNGMLSEEGLFRVPGNPVQVDKLKLLYNTDPKASLNLAIALGADAITAHTAASLMKVYFRELPQPLLTYRFYTTFIKVQKNADEEARLKNMRLLVRGLPSHNKDLLLFMMKFLNKVSQYSDKNKMNVNNLAVVWGPNLLRAENETIDSMAIESHHVVSIVATLIENVEFMSVEKKTLLEKAESSDGLPPLPGLTTPVNSSNGLPVTSPKTSHTTGEARRAGINGWLIKQGGGVKTWKRRFFVLDEHNLVLSYYKNETLTKEPLGTIPLLGFEVEKADKDNVKKPYAFKLTHPGPCRTWYFSAQSEGDREYWVRAINAAVKKVMSSGSSGHVTQANVRDNDEDIPEEEEKSTFNEEEWQLKLQREEKRLDAEEAELQLQEDFLNQEEALVNEEEELLRCEEEIINNKEKRLKNQSVPSTPLPVAPQQVDQQVEDELSGQPPAYHEL